MTQPTRTPELFVEKLAQGELSESQAREVKERLARESGENRLEALHQSDADILAEYSPVQMAASIRGRFEMAQAARRRKMSLMLLPASAAIAAAAALLFIVMPLNQHHGTAVIPGVTPGGAVDGGGDYVGIKSGAPVLAVGKKSPGGQEWLQSGAEVREGDELQLKFQTATARHLVICSVDGRGGVTVHFPESEGGTTAVTPGAEQTMPFGYTLDDAPAFERFFVVWSEDANTPISVDAVRRAVKEMKHPETDTLNLGRPLKIKDMILKKAE